MIPQTGERFILSGKMCKPCQEVKAFLEKNKINIKTLYINEDYSFEEFREQEFLTTPTLVLEDGDRVRGGQAIIQYFSTR